MKRRMGWQKPTDYAAEMAQRNAEEPGPGEAAPEPSAFDQGLRVDAAPEPMEEQELRGRIDPRTVVGLLLWGLFVLAASFLAVGALLVALEVSRESGIVQFVLDGADAVDLGVFSKDNGLFTFSGKDAETQGALVNWGLGALAWLIVGRVLERLIRP